MTNALALGLLTAIPAAAGIALIARGRMAGSAAGVVLLGLAAVLPLFLAYGFGAGVVGAIAGAGAALALVGRTQPRGRLAVLAAAAAGVAAVPILVTTGFQIQRDESFDRCAAARAVAIADLDGAAGGYPADLHDLALQDTGPDSGPCYVSSAVNWLYRVGGGEYTLGYWVDWRVSRRVCLHTARVPGWTCGFERWEGFRPGERDS